MKSKLFRVHHMLGYLFVFATSTDRAAELFVSEWEHRFGDAPGAFSVEELVRFKYDDEFASRTKALLVMQPEGIAFYSTTMGWLVFSVGANRELSPVQL